MPDSNRYAAGPSRLAGGSGANENGSNYWPEVKPQLENNADYLNGEVSCTSCMNPFTTRDRYGPMINAEDVEASCGPLVILPCGHLMGLPCLNAWLKTAPRFGQACSICRAPLVHSRCKHQVNIARLWPGTTERQQRTAPDVTLPELCPICRLVDTFRNHICAVSSDTFAGAVLDVDFVAYSHIVDQTISKQFRVNFEYSRNGGAQADGSILRRRVLAALDEYKRDGARFYQPGEMIVRVRHFENVFMHGELNIREEGNSSCKWLYVSVNPVKTTTPDVDLQGYHHPLLEFPEDVPRIQAQVAEGRPEDEQPDLPDYEDLSDYEVLPLFGARRFRPDAVWPRVPSDNRYAGHQNNFGIITPDNRRPILYDLGSEDAIDFDRPNERVSRQHELSPTIHSYSPPHRDSDERRGNRASGSRGRFG
jgi:hypothetical protein